MKIFVTREIPEVGLAMLREKGYEVDVNPKNKPLKKKQLIKALKKKPYDAVITLLTDVIDADVVAAAANVKIFANYAVGFNNIDLKAVQAKNIFVTNARGASDEAVAEHAVALMLSLAHRVVEGDQFVRDGKYTGWDPMLLTGFDLRGLTLGLIGAGAIGKHVAKICRNGFGMNIFYYDIVRNEEMEQDFGAIYSANLDEVLEKSDVVSLHTPLLDTTKHLIDAENFSKMKKSAILINTSRGPVVDEKALLEALKNGTIRGAGIDVYEKEPEVTKGLMKLDNVVLTPHIASATAAARDGMSKIVAENVIAALEGQVPPNLIKMQ